MAGDGGGERLVITAKDLTDADRDRLNGGIERIRTAGCTKSSTTASG
jgi:hypothetical protein